MKKGLDENKVAVLTGKAIQDDETFKSEGGFIPERDQYYFEMQQGDNVFLVGFKDLLTDSGRYRAVRSDFPCFQCHHWHHT